MSDIRKYINLVESAQVNELYSSNNKYLLQHLSAEDFDPYACWFEVCLWIERNDLLGTMSEILGEEIADADDLHEHDPELFYKLPADVQEECGSWCIDYMMQHNPAEAPSSAHMSVSQNKLLPRTTWLIHFSDEAEAIAYNGFKYGIDQMDHLGLTTYFNDSAKKQGGYNFAFLANGRHARYAASKRKYGRNAVLFQNSGVLVHHHGDEEDQVIFRGDEVNQNGIVYLRNYEGDWMVMSRRVKRGEEARALFKGEFEDCVKWVQANIVQYRRALTGF